MMGMKRGSRMKSRWMSKAMFALLGLKSEADKRDADVPIVFPTPNYAIHDSKGAAMVIDDKAPEEPLTVWDERKPKMETGTTYPHMVAFRKAFKQFATNGEFEYGTKKNEPERFRAFLKFNPLKVNLANGR
jgi:hypothetical protein